MAYSSPTVYYRSNIPHDARSKSNGRDLHTKGMSDIARAHMEIRVVFTNQFKLAHKLLRFAHALQVNQ